jgi:hypothetical protein
MNELMFNAPNVIRNQYYLLTVLTLSGYSFFSGFMVILSIVKYRIV